MKIMSTCAVNTTPQLFLLENFPYSSREKVRASDQKWLKTYGRIHLISLRMLTIMRPTSSYQLHLRRIVPTWSSILVGKSGHTTTGFIVMVVSKFMIRVVVMAPMQYLVMTALVPGRARGNYFMLDASKLLVINMRSQ